jgi:hypothetical protein
MQKVSFVILMAVILPFTSTAQWTYYSSTGVFITPVNVKAVGIGSFQSNATWNSPQSRLHVFNDLCQTPEDAQYNGELFRTDGNLAVDNFWRFYTGNSILPANNIERFRIQVENNDFTTHLKNCNPGNESDLKLGNSEITFSLSNYEVGKLLRTPILPDEVSIGNSSADDGAGTNVILNSINTSTLKGGVSIWAQNGNISMGRNYLIQPPTNVQTKITSNAIPGIPLSNYQSSEVMLDARVADDNNSYLRLQNASVNASTFVPLVAGFNSGNNTGLILSSKVPNNSDVSTNPALMEFDVRKGDSTSVAQVVNRNLFRWCNFSVVPMLMSAQGRLGIKPNNLVPLENRVEIEAGVGDPAYSTNAGLAGFIGSSGLRFKRMNSTSTPENNPGLGLLSLNSNGDVIYVSNQTAQCTWNLIGINDMSTGTATSCRTGNIGIGTNTPVTKLHVQNTNVNTNNISGEQIDVSGGIVNTKGILSRANGLGNSYVIGVEGVATGSLNKNVGGKFWVDFSQNTLEGIGCLGQANFMNNQGAHIGIQGEASGGNTNIGLRAAAFGQSNASSNFGVLAEAPGIGINWAVYANGKVGTTAGYYVISDIVVKNTPQEIPNSVDIINGLNPKVYTYKTSQFPNLHMPEGEHYGLIAQDVVNVFPNAVQTGFIPQNIDPNSGQLLSDSMSFKMINYSEFVPLLIDLAKKQQSKIDSLEIRINDCCASAQQFIDTPNSNVTVTSVHVPNTLNVILFQNNPNPFEEQTEIKINLTDYEKNSELIIHNSSGIEIFRIELAKTFSNILRIDLSDFPSGTYIYSLNIENRTFDSKKMVKK